MSNGLTGDISILMQSFYIILKLLIAEEGL
jgi:hypothetical protein